MTEFAVGDDDAVDSETFAGVCASHAAATRRRGELTTHSQINAPTPFNGVPLRVNGEAYGMLEFCGQIDMARFFRGDATSFVTVLAKLICDEFARRDEIEGSGIGLGVVKRIARALEGDVAVRSCVAGYIVKSASAGSVVNAIHMLKLYATVVELP